MEYFGFQQLFNTLNEKKIFVTRKIFSVTIETSGRNSIEYE